MEGKVVVITGGTAGIGLACAQRFQKEGATVVVCSRKSDSVNAVVKEIGCDGITANVSNAKDRDKLIEFVKNKYQRIDVLVLNAATSLSFGSSEDCSETAWDKMMDTNVKSSWLLAKRALPIITPQTGSIVLISSFAGYNPDFPLGVYGVTKTALLGLTRMMANEFGRSSGIRVNCVAPGVIKTRFSKALWANEGISEAVKTNSPLGRIGSPEEVAGPVVFLSSTDATFITGETLVVAGGTFCKL